MTSSIDRRKVLKATAAVTAAVALPIAGASTASGGYKSKSACFVDHEALVGSLFHNITRDGRFETVGADALHDAKCPVCSHSLRREIAGTAV